MDVTTLETWLEQLSHEYPYEHATNEERQQFYMNQQVQVGLLQTSAVLQVALQLDKLNRKLDTIGAAIRSSI